MGKYVSATNCYLGDHALVTDPPTPIVISPTHPAGSKYRNELNRTNEF